MLQMGPGPDTTVIIVGIPEIIVAPAGIGTAVALYPLLRKQNEGIALGFAGSRVLEAVLSSLASHSSCRS